ncbi:hypothetical protein [Pseudonocardia lacus]|uniref:hypothetical protein n=1 Tax=Pseudonocardia lacus TaxID=2835865 RepID=UPI001BDC2B88|nr:hypothetical protein [Pseudonocardia lacus]
MTVDRDPRTAERNPAKALVAVAIGIGLIVVMWLRAGPWALVLSPLVVPFVISVYLGGKLTENTVESIHRIRAFRDRHR